MSSPQLHPPASRDRALDLVRAVALARVVAWHAFATTWLLGFASMPLMFFVVGTLIGPGDGRPFRTFLVRRARRVLLPLWAYGAAIGATMAYVPLGDDRWVSVTDIAWRAATWVIPLVDPADSTWHGGWLSNHLWYLRAYLWIILLAPLLRSYARRPVLAASIFLLGLAQLEMAARFGLPGVGKGTGRVLLGDVLAYGLFAMLGIAFASRRRRFSTSALVASAAGFAVAAVAFAITVGLPEGGINASYPAVVLTGLAWVSALAATEAQIRRVADVPVVARMTEAVSRRAVTIYLWHPVAIVAAHGLIDLPGFAGAALVAAATVAFTAVAVLLVGWVEDVAAGRGLPPMARSIPMLRLATAIPVSVAVLTVAVPILVVSPADAAAGAAGRGPRPPSYREVLTHSAFARAAVPADAPFVLKNGRMPADSLQKALDRWVKDHSTVTSVAVGVAVEGQIWTGDARRTRRPPVASAADRFRVQSLTKTFTIALVLREVEAGRIALDAPVPRLRGVVSSRSWPAITPRQLLMHTSGLINYPEAPGYRADRPVTPEAAVNLALRAPRVGEPGERVHYSNTNYLYLGVLLEAVAGRPYAELLRDLTAPMGLADTGLEPPPEGWAWHASGGVHSTVGDMARWGSALFTPGAVLPPHRTADLTTVTDHYVGLGTWPMCPCSTDDTGTKRYTAIGQYVGFGGMYHFPRQMTLVVRLEPESGDAADLYADLSRHLGDVFRTAR